MLRRNFLIARWSMSSQPNALMKLANGVNGTPYFLKLETYEFLRHHWR